MNFYSYLYRPIQSLLIFLLSKKNFTNLIQNYFKKNQFDEIYDIGCSDGKYASILDLKKAKYFGYDIDLININKAKKKFSSNKNVNFYYKYIKKINIKNNKKKKIFVLNGVFHHINDKQISSFLKKISSKDKVIAIDAFYHKNQNIISVILKRMDQGKHIRNYEGYKKILHGFKLTKKISYYMRCYSHLLSTRNIDNKNLKFFD